MKLHKLFHLLALLALVACVPTAGPTVAPPTSTRTAEMTVSDTPTSAIATTAAPTATDTSQPTDTATAEPPTTASPSPTPTQQPPSATPSPTGPQWGNRNKTSGCQANGALPDPACTPGDIFPDVTAAQVCVPGYSSSVRDVSTSTKDAVYAEYGITSHTTGQYEVDHLVSLELGGSNDISNLWPEAASPTPGFHQKDEVENYLHDQVCRGAMPLAEAQQEIATNWLAVYATMIPSGPPPVTVAPANTQAPQPTQSQLVPTLEPQLTAPAAQPTSPPSGSSFSLVSLTSPVSVGGQARAVIQTAPGAGCLIRYITPHGTVSKAQGLGPATADGNGTCRWSWDIGPGTLPGTGTVTITANGETQSFPIVIQ